jgi:hypothetical protein
VSSPFPTSINKLAEILNKRGITKEQAVTLELGPMVVEEAFRHLGYKAKGSISFLEALPYFDADGHPLGEPQFYRFRVNYTPGWSPPEGDWDDYPKYRGPYRKGEFAYLPRGVGIDWVAVHGNPEVPVIITEGEYKAIKVCSAWKQPCIGLGGVWMFHARKTTWPEGMDMDVLGRTFYIAFDADKESTYDTPLKGGVRGVEGAAKRLANKVYSQGGKPILLFIARTATFTKARESNPDAKMGLDDYIEAGGTWKELLAQFADPIESAGLAYLMDTYAFYRGEKPGVVNVKTGHFYKTVEFKDVEANCKQKVLIEKGGKLVETVLKYAPVYLEHEDRPEFSRWVFEPSTAPGLCQAEGTYNRWEGMTIEGWVGPGEGERYRELVSEWRKFIKGLCGDGWEYFEKWAADLYQNPGRKTTIAMLLRCSLNGVGKSLLGEVLRDMVGPKHSARMGLGDVTHHFNALLGDRVLVQVDEANDVRKEHDSALKNLVTADECTVTLKGRDTIIVKNYARIFITSNHISPIVLDEHNRRFFVMEPVLTEEDERGEWAQWVNLVIAKLLRSAEGLRMLRWHLGSLDLSDWVPTAHVPKTAAMMDIVEASTSKTVEFFTQVWEAFLADPEGVWVFGPMIMRSPDCKLLAGRFKDKVKLTNGQYITHVMKVPGEASSKRVPIFVRAGRDRLPEKRVKDQGNTLDTAVCAVDNKWLLDRMTAAEKAFNSWSGVVPSGKY